jgi:sporulation protein YlmC with PRC-barrel domain
LLFSKIPKLLIERVRIFYIGDFLVSINELTGKKVVGVNGDAIGDVKDVEFDMQTWKITYLMLKLTDRAAVEMGYRKTSGSMGPLSVNRGNNHVFMPVGLISAISDVITINKTLLEITEGQLVKKYSE